MSYESRLNEHGNHKIARIQDFKDNNPAGTFYIYIYGQRVECVEIILIDSALEFQTVDGKKIYINPKDLNGVEI